MTRCVTVLCTERRTKGVDGTQGCSAELTLKLARHGEVRLLAEEILIILYLAALCYTVKVERGDLEHLACTLSITGRDQRCVEIVEAMLMEILVDGDGHIMTDTEDGTESVGAQTHVRVLAHVLKGLALLLHRIIGRAETVDLNLLSLNLNGLTFTLALHERSRSTDTCARGDALQHLGIELLRCHNDLNVLNR